MPKWSPLGERIEKFRQMITQRRKSIEKLQANTARLEARLAKMEDKQKEATPA